MKPKCPRCKDVEPKESEDLGDVIWYRCRRCGMGWTRFKYEVEEEIDGNVG